MSIDPEVLKKILETFKEELNEQLQVITDGLLKLEKGSLSVQDNESIITTIFRSAHNIKGAARGVGVKEVGDIAHHIESLFSAIQKKSLAISPIMINLCLEAVDGMRLAMDAFTQHKTLPFDIQAFLARLATGEINNNVSVKSIDKHNTSDGPQSKINISKDYETIRVSIDSLDRVTALMEEIQVCKISIEDQYNDLLKLNSKTKQIAQVWKQAGYIINNNEIVKDLQKLYLTNNDNLLEMTTTTHQLEKNMHKCINELAIFSNSLQEELRMLRLIPASTLLSTLPRVVRDISQELKKKVELTITGDTVKMDKLILEGLQNPLIHLLRNAIDHGIEEANIRLGLGKPETGQIKLHIQDEGNNILISVSDDGAGMDVSKIAQLAKEKNIINQSALDSMNQADILELIFYPGFSTKEIITDVSGRGIGLDVVRTNIADLKGHVSLTTKVSKGTVFYLKLPLTLASERGLLIKCAGELFVLPTTVVERVLLINARDIIDLEGRQAIVLEGHPVPLVSLAAILAFEYQPPNNLDQIHIVVLKQERNTVALLVDQIIGEREIVIKSLSEPLAHISSVMGGTLAGNGQAIIVLNTNNIIQTALNLKSSSRILAQESTEKITERTHILVVDDSITTRTLEKNILESKNYQVTVAVNGKEAWDLLQKKKFALMIVDVNMPIMDGFTLTEMVKQSEQLSELPVIIVTSLESNEEKKRGIEVGADAYIVKNQFESEALLDIVAQLV